jgi:hypothetical protein
MLLRGDLQTEAQLFGSPWGNRPPRQSTHLISRSANNHLVDAVL